MPRARRIPPLFVPALLLLALLLASCARPPGLYPVPDQDAQALSMLAEPAVQDLASWTDLAPAIRESLDYVRTRPQDAPALDRDKTTATWAQVRRSLELLLELLPELDRNPSLLAERFRWIKVEPSTLVTGYYEPLVEASLTPDPCYPYPLYGLPDDLLTADLGRFHYRWSGQRLVYRLGKDGIEPYPDREAIDQGGALAGRGLEIAWARNPVDVFFLHIQGSGRLALPNGETRHVLYAGRNGRPYVSLGRVLLDRGLLTREEMSMQAIRRVLEDNPHLMDELLAENPSYVFFVLADQGPFGASGALLTPKVSLAVDPNFLPLGGLLAMDVSLPREDGGQDRLVGLGLAQDKGGAIKDNHVDLFFGSGPEAEFTAGHLQDRGAVYLLLAREQ